jgi:hypothetical protein
MNEYKGWSIRATPSFDSSVKRWQARVEVWPPESPPESRPGIRVHFSDGAGERAAVEQAALAAARRYIDASIAVHQ